MVIVVGRGGAGGSASVLSSPREVVVVRGGQQPRQPPRPPAPQRRAAAHTASRREVVIEEEADDIIDLGAPRRLRRPRAPDAARPRRPRALLPNPRLYPGPKPKPQPKPRVRSRRGKRTLRRPVPNSRLYRPGPPRAPAPPPPPARPRAAWPPPAPPAPRALDTASRAALRLDAHVPPPAPPPPPPARHLVVTLPSYRPASEHYRARAAAEPGSGHSTPPAARLRPRPRAMDAARRHSASPEDRSEGNDTHSAPSEFLAEFLSAIMRRQYAEALKYCRLILQYEPHNATARGFYPLLRHKVARAQRTEAAAATAAADGADDSSSDEAAARSSADDSPRRQEELMEHSAASEGESEASAAGDHSELELDSSDALHSSPSLSPSRRTDRTDRTDSASASAGCWESTGSASRSEPDDNGNAALAPPASAHLLPDDLENDNAAEAGGGEPHHSTRLKSGGGGGAEPAAALRRLRAQFACSIK